MATPIQFPEANTAWKGWEADEYRDEVGDLPSYRDDAGSVSCWKMTWRERLAILFTGRAWLHVFGELHPPVYVGGEYPFEDDKLWTPDAEA